MSSLDPGMMAWVDENLEITHRDLSLENARRWVRLLMRDEHAFYSLALYGFVKRRRRFSGLEAYPEQEFADFCGEFLFKIQLVIKGKYNNIGLPLFERVGGVMLAKIVEGSNRKGRRVRL